MTADVASEQIRRLITLISRVAYAESGKCGMRELIAISAPEMPEELAVSAHEMCMYYAGAVKHLRGDGGTSAETDFYELADFTLPFVTNVDPAAEQRLGEILIGTLGMLPRVNSQAIGRKWLDDVVDLCWNIKLASAPEQYGQARYPSRGTGAAPNGT
ncbi:hypothetical protein [Amycolatopsis japonica]